MSSSHAAVRASALGARWLLVLAVLAVCLTLAHAGHVNCRVNVFHQSCRGVSRRSGRTGAAGSGNNRELRRFLRTYLSDQSRARKLRALERYLSLRKPSHVSEERTASLLDRLLRTEDDYTDYDLDL